MKKSSEILKDILITSLILCVFWVMPDHSLHIQSTHSHSGNICFGSIFNLCHHTGIYLWNCRCAYQCSGS